MKNALGSMSRIFLALLALAMAPAVHAADWNFSAQAPDTGKGMRQEWLRMAPGMTKASVVSLGVADDADIEMVRHANADASNKRLQIGIGREVPRSAAASSASLDWQAVSGGMAAHWMVSSAGARAIRIGLDVARLAPSAEVRFAGNGGAGTVYGPYSIADLTSAQGTWWSPVLEDDSALVEVFVGDRVAVADVSISIALVSHLFASPTAPNIDALAKASQACEVNLICLSASNAALANIGKSVAKMTFSDGLGGGTFLCTGTLLNPSDGSFTPYFYSAAHCMSTQAAASTLTTHWFYDAASCAGTTAGSSYEQLAGGATLLYVNTTSDVLFLRLNSMPPSAATYAGWNSSTLSNGVALTAVHHPAGDIKKVSLGTMGGFSGYLGGAGSDHLISLWNSTATGVTEGGSSGSGIFSSTGSDYQLRGGLHGGPSNCTATGADLRDYYSRFDQAYPNISQYLSPPASCSYSLSSSSASVGSGGGSGSFTVSTSSGCNWSATSGASWISTSSSGSGSGTVQYSVSANTSTSARTGTISAGGQTFTITQSGQSGGGSTTSLITNGGFESGSSAWTQSPSNIITNDSSLARSGSYYAWLGGAISSTDVLYQDVTIPANATQATFQFWYRIFTQEAAGSGDYDFLNVTINSPSSGATLATIVSYSNSNAVTNWTQTPLYDLTAFRGQTVRIKFTATNDFSNYTSFRIDDVAFTATTSGGAASNYTALWYKPGEDGWGVNFNHQGNIVFGTLFTYDSAGAPMWLVMSAGYQQADGVTYTGDLFRTTGPAFNANPFTPIGAGNVTTVGTMSVTFASADAATLTYTYNGTRVTKTIQRQVYGSRAATCTATTGSRTSLSNYQDLWYKSGEDGWGVNVTHQDNIVFATLFTYDSTGKGMWLVMSAGYLQGDGSYLGTLYRTTGPAFNAVPFTPINAGNLTNVGTMRFSFSSGTTGTLTYTYNGTQVIKAIARQVFSSPLPACAS
jgi:lysyl endopeptidase